MYRILIEQYEIEKLVESYFYIIDLPRALKYFGDSERHGYGSGPLEVQFSTYHEPNEEYYIGDRKVCFIGEPPAYDEDVLVVMEYDQFYNYLITYSGKHLDEHPEDINKINNLLEIIKSRLDI
ncbi:hypothetical protein ASD24_25205 [Paenibacillus sp. Root52]|uniref:ribonuclease toxin immunity protein CdiI n=1 Tax=Paenibacillus sp. Root52 TaxID=1736552 RepID=UPI0006FB6585|nr:ribonuclease toxin immunity protein CdiI [Paenibacillus sp. Root52]KQY90201.1 hypothetical protein ASD24_25205 [Paenibacillus sp. Root52]